MLLSETTLVLNYPRFLNHFQSLTGPIKLDSQVKKTNKETQNLSFVQQQYSNSGPLWFLPGKLRIVDMISPFLCMFESERRHFPQEDESFLFFPVEN